MLPAVAEVVFVTESGIGLQQRQHQVEWPVCQSGVLLHRRHPGAGHPDEPRASHPRHHPREIRELHRHHERGQSARSGPSSKPWGCSDGSGGGGLEAAQDGGVAGDGQAAITGLGRGKVAGEQAEDEPRDPLQDQVGGWRVAEPGAYLAA